MNARIRIARRVCVPTVVDSGTCSGLPQGKWRRFQRAVGRITLLLGSPIASFRWAMAKRRAIARKNGNTSDGQKSLSNFAQYERDGIVMGF